MRTLYIHSSELPSKRANSVHALAMVAALLRKGHDVHLLAPTIVGGMSAILNALPCETQTATRRLTVTSAHSSQLGVPRRLRMLAAALSTLRSARYDIAISRFIPIALLAPLVRTTLLIDVHMPPRHMSRGMHAIFLLLKWFSPKNVRILAISRVLKTLIESDYPGLHVSGVAHDGAFCTNHTITLEEYLTRPFSCVFVGSLNRGKGYDMLIQIAKAMPEVPFHIFGDGDSNQTDCDPVPQNVSLHGRIRPSDVLAAISKHAIFMNPAQPGMTTYGNNEDISQYNSPLKLFEAMSVGLPVVTSDFPNIREIVSDSDALLVKHDDLAGWLAAIDHLRRDPRFAFAVGERARLRFEEQFEWAHRCDKFIACHLHRSTDAIS